jgi:CheY-like chemotaxis protein
MPPASTPAPRLVLCVDDELVGLSARRSLLEHAGYKVLTALNGRDALVLFEREPVEAVVLDYFMPGMRGHEVATRMRQLKPDVPILLLSAHLDLLEQVTGLVDVYMVKGEGPAKFLKALESLFQPTPAPKHP